MKEAPFENLHRNGTYTEHPKRRPRDGYENHPKVARTVKQFDDLRRGLARDLEIERLRRVIHNADHGVIQ